MDINKRLTFKIVSKKHNGTLHRVWEENTILSYEHNLLIGGNNKTIVTEANGSKWRTSDPALFYFDFNKWFNIIIILEKNNYFYYCNISSPAKWKINELHYIDYDIDIIVNSDYYLQVVDKDEYEQNRQMFNYSNHLHNQIKQSVSELKMIIDKRIGPFNETFVNKWSTIYFEQLRQNK